MRPKPGVDAREFIETHFRDILGKVYAPYDDKDVIALALDNRKQFDEENLHVLAELGGGIHHCGMSARTRSA